MDNVIDIEDYREAWSPVNIRCNNCTTEWYGVVHKDIKIFECPHCFNMKGEIYIKDEITN